MTKFQKFFEKLKLKCALEKQAGWLAPVTLSHASPSPHIDSLYSRLPKLGNTPMYR